MRLQLDVSSAQPLRWHPQAAHPGGALVTHRQPDRNESALTLPSLTRAGNRLALVVWALVAVVLA